MIYSIVALSLVWFVALHFDLDLTLVANWVLSRFSQSSNRSRPVHMYPVLQYEESAVGLILSSK